MKHLFCSLFFLVSITGFSQEPKAVVEVNNMNVVYRGVSNPLTLSMPGTVSFEASAPGLKKIDDYGNYSMSPGSGLTVDIELRGKLTNGEIVTAIKTLRIKDISKPVGTINGLGCVEKCIIELTKEELKNGKIGIKFEDFMHKRHFVVTQFKIELSKAESYIIDGNNFNEEVKRKIDVEEYDTIIFIKEIKWFISGVNSYFLKTPTQIRIKITE